MSFGPLHPKITPFQENSPESYAGDGADVEPWRKCYREMSAKLLLYARQFLEESPFSSPQEAEDVVQTAFVRFWRMFPNAQSDHYGLLFAAVKSAALDTLRSSRRRVLRQDTYSEQVVDFRDSTSLQGSRATWFTAPMDQQWKADRIQDALLKIPTEQREVIILKVWGEMTFAEIANSINESANTVASRYRLGVSALKKLLSPNGFADL